LPPSAGMLSQFKEVDSGKCASVRRTTGLVITVSPST
jgi:hypothetical protein